MFQLQHFFLLHCDEWDRVVALPRHKFVTGATLLQLEKTEGPIKNGQSRETGNTKNKTIVATQNLNLLIQISVKIDRVQGHEI